MRKGFGHLKAHPIVNKNPITVHGRFRVFLLGIEKEFYVVPSKQEMLDNLETAINARMTGGTVQSYSIGGRNIQYISLSELLKLRDQLRKEIAAGKNTTTYAKFNNPT